MEKPKQHFNILTGGFVIGTAIIVDAVQILLDITVFLSLVAGFLGLVFTFLYFFWLKYGFGIELAGGSNGLGKALTMGGMSVVSIIPEVDGLPEFTAGIAAIVVMTYLEDKAKLLKWEQAQKVQPKPRNQVMQEQRERMGIANGNPAAEAT